MNYDKLTKDIITVEDKNNLVKLIENAENDIYKSKNKIPDVFEDVMKDMSESDVKNPIKLKKIFEDIKTHLESIKIVEIEVASYLGSKSIKTISSWFRENLKEIVFLSLKVEKDILAGLKVAYNGKFLDLSKQKVFDA